MVRILVEYLPEWREEHSDMPVVTLEFFHSKTREQINPLVSEDRMKMCVSALHDLGEVRKKERGKGGLRREKGEEREGKGEGERERGRER